MKFQTSYNTVIFFLILFPINLFGEVEFGLKIDEFGNVGIRTEPSANQSESIFVDGNVLFLNDLVIKGNIILEDENEVQTNINEFNQLKLEPQATAPSNPEEGMVYLNTSGEISVYSNGVWQVIGADVENDLQDVEQNGSEVVVNGSFDVDLSSWVPANSGGYHESGYMVVNDWPSSMSQTIDVSDFNSIVLSYDYQHDDYSITYISFINESGQGVSSFNIKEFENANWQEVKLLFHLTEDVKSIKVRFNGHAHAESGEFARYDNVSVKGLNIPRFDVGNVANCQLWVDATNLSTLKTTFHPVKLSGTDNWTEIIHDSNLSEWYLTNAPPPEGKNSLYPRPLLELDVQNNNSILRFDGTDLMDLGQNVDLTNHTIFLVSQSSSLTVAEGTILGSESGQNDSLVLRENGKLSIKNNGTEIIGNSASFSGDFVINRIEFTNDSISIFENGKNITEGDGAISESFQIRYIGGTDGLSSFVGDLGEFIIFDRVLTNEESNNIESYLSSKWDIELSETLGAQEYLQLSAMSQAPSSPIEGMLYLNDAGVLNLYTNGEWSEITGDSSTVSTQDQGTNLVLNGGFDGDLNSWSFSASDVVHDATEGADELGSVKVLNWPNGASQFINVSGYNKVRVRYKYKGEDFSNTRLYFTRANQSSLISQYIFNPASSDWIEREFTSHLFEGVEGITIALYAGSTGTYSWYDDVTVELFNEERFEPDSLLNCVGWFNPSDKSSVGYGWMYSEEGMYLLSTIDSTGSEKDAIQVGHPMYVDEVQNGHGIIRFDGTKMLDLDTDSYSLNEGTVFLVAKTAPQSNDEGLILGGDTTDDFIKLFEQGEIRIGSNGEIATGQHMSLPDEFSFYRITLKDNLLTIFENGTNITTSQDFYSTLNIRYFGGVAGLQKFIGDFGELIIYDRVLTNSEVNGIEDYLSEKWSINKNHSNNNVLNITPQSEAPANPILGDVFLNTNDELFVFTSSGWRQVQLDEATTTPDINSGLLGYWAFEETSGTIAFDSSGQERHANLLNGYSFDTSSVEGKIGYALHGDGSTNAINIPEDPVIANLGSGEFTVSAWVNIESRRSLFAKRNGDQSDGFEIGSGGGQMFVNLWDAESDDQIELAFLIGQSLNTWFHFTITKKGNQYRAYANGVESSTGPLTSYEDVSCQTMAYIGAHWKLLGVIDELKVYDRALSDEEVLKNASVPTIQSNYLELTAMTSPPAHPKEGTVYLNEEGELQLYQNGEWASLQQEETTLSEPEPVNDNLLLSLGQLLHLDASNFDGDNNQNNNTAGPVSFWKDLSGKNHHAFRNYKNSLPELVEDQLNGMPVMRFDMDILETDSIDWGEAFTIFIVVKHEGGENYNRIIDSTHNERFTLSQPGAANDYAFGVNGSSGSSVGSVGDWDIISMTFDGSTSKLYEDGSLLDTNTGISEITVNNGPLNIGGYGPSSAGAFGKMIGEIAEIIVYDSALSDSNRRSVEGYLQEKWLPSLISEEELLIATASLHLDASDVDADGDTSNNNAGRISAWNDLSSQGRNMTQGAATRQPEVVKNVLNGHDVVRFGTNTGGEGLRAGNLDWEQKFSVFLVVKVDAAVQGSSRILDNGYNRIFALTTNNPPVSYNSYVNGSSTTAGGSANDWDVITLIYDGNLSSIYENGRLISAKSVVETETTPSLGYFSLASDQNYNLNVSCDVAELIIFESAFSNEERFKVESFLRNKYSL